MNSELKDSGFAAITKNEVGALRLMKNEDGLHPNEVASLIKDLRTACALIK